jgi:hypothetical protein
MGALTLEFESKLNQESHLKPMWDKFHSVLEKGKVESRAEAYVHFSDALKITQLVAQDNSLKQLWVDLLSSKSFSMCVAGEEPIEYNFHTITDLIKSGKESFEVEIVEVDPKKTNLKRVAEAVHSICTTATGSSPGIKFFETKIASPNNLCLLAQHHEDTVACMYGTYVELPNVNVFHLNYLGRKIEYPSIHLLKTWGGEIERILNKYPNIDYLTLGVQGHNERVIPLYQEIGFEKKEFIEDGYEGKPMYFFVKKVNPLSNAEPPTRSEVNTEIKAQRAREESAKETGSGLG